jgi:hypothetical protein
LPEFVKNGDFGLASGRQPEGRFLRVWFREALPADEIEFADDVYLLLPSTAEAYKKPTATVSTVEPTVVEPNVPPSTGAPTGETVAGSLFEESPGARPDAKMQKLRISGEIPPEIWQRLGHTLVPKLKASQNFRLGLDISVVVETAQAATLRREITQILEDLKLGGRVKIELMQGA